MLSVPRFQEQQDKLQVLEVESLFLDGPSRRARGRGDLLVAGAGGGAGGGHAEEKCRCGVVCCTSMCCIVAVLKGCLIALAVRMVCCVVAVACILSHSGVVWPYFVRFV